MIPRSPTVKLVALLIAGGAHAALLVGLVEPEPARIAGAGGAAEARLGTSFRDLVEGGVAVPTDPSTMDRATPERPDLAERPDPAEARAPGHVEASPLHTPPTRQPTVPAAMPRSASPDRMQAQTPAPAGTAATRPEPVAPVPPDEPAAARPVTADRINAGPVTPVAPATGVQRAEGVATDGPAAAFPVRTDTVLPALAETSPAPLRSLRPPERPESVARRAPPEVAPPRPPAPQPSAAGNAPRTATAGSAAGRTDAPSPSSGAAGAPATAGNAAAGNYPGEVMACISRAGRPRVGARGTAVVSFRIDGGGRVTGVALAASSGDAGLDRAALRTIGGAGPCPAPPPGAQTAFSIRVQGR